MARGLKFTIEGVTIRGFHEHKHHWVPRRGERLRCAINGGPISALKDQNICGNVPKEWSIHFRKWLHAGGKLEAIVCGLYKLNKRKGGEEVPVIYLFSGDSKSLLRNIKNAIEEETKKRKKIKFQNGDGAVKQIIREKKAKQGTAEPRQPVADSSNVSRPSVAGDKVTRNRGKRGSINGDTPTPMKRKKSQTTGQMMTLSKADTCHEVIDRSMRRLKQYMIPIPIVDCSTGFDLFTYIDRRDIKEMKNTTEKNHSILTKIRAKGFGGYTDFKKCLKETGQSKLVDLLERVENGLDTSDLETELDAIAEQALANPDYRSLNKGVNTPIQEDFQIELIEKDFSKLSLIIGGNWKHLMLHLGLNDVQISHIEMDTNKTQDRIFKSFVKWRNKHPEKNSLGCVMKAIDECPKLKITQEQYEEFITAKRQ